MNIAYIILAHKSPWQLIRLVERLDGEHVSFFIHYDRKSEVVDYELIKSTLKKKTNVHFMKRMRTHWGDFSLAWVPVLGIREILKSPKQFERAIYITGQCYPIKSNSYILDRMAEEPDRSYMEFFPLPTSNWSQGGLDRIQNLHLVRNRRIVVKIKSNRKIPYQLLPYGGSGYWCLTREACEYTLNFINIHKKMYPFFLFTKSPVEIFFQTILMNSNLKNKIENENLWYIDWTRKPAPAILRINDFDVLQKSDKLFARKFDTRVDTEILDMIDRRLL